jgi:SEC-C motif
MNREQRVRFVTGANSRYFFMCGMLLESLDEFFPEILSFVMDFGMTEPEAQFFEAKKKLVRLPPSLKKEDHPYKLKSNMHSFLGAQFTGTSIWVDADIIAVNAGQSELLEILDKLTHEQKLLAIAPDAGPNKTIRQFSESFRTPKFNSVLENHAEMKNCPYLNGGLVFFPDSKVLEDWALTAGLLEGDVCWEQNALNLMCHKNPNRVLILDSRVWNAHAELLNRITISDGMLRYDRQKCIFAHATGANTHAVEEELTMLPGKGYIGAAYFRWFKNSHLRAAQEKYRSNFLSNHSATLMDLKILLKPSSIRRNDLCPCGSGKKVKHCHATYF